MGKRRTRKDQIIADQATSRLVNGFLKTKERSRRDRRMRDLIKNGKPPYTPAVRSWLSVQTGKPSRLITQDDVDAVMKG